MRLVFQTSANSFRNRTKDVIKQAFDRAGVALELKSVDASVFFSSDPGNPDTFGKFYADMQMYTATLTQPDPGLFMQQFLPDQVSHRGNRWQNRNVTRWVSKEYEETFEAAAVEVDPIKRTALLIRLNDLVIEDVVVVPVILCRILRRILGGSATKLRTRMSSWDTYLWNLAAWHRDA